MQESKNPTRKIIVITLLVLLIPVLIWLVILWINRNKVDIEIGVTPAGSYLTLDGKEVKPGKYTVEKGEHTLFAKHEFFEDATLVFNTNNTDVSKTIYVAPYPNSPEAQAWLDSHPEDMQVWQIITGRQFDNEVQNANERYPVLKYLPRNTLDWRIDYTLNENGSATFTITTLPYSDPGTADYIKQVETFNAQALEFLKDNGVKVEQEDIVYKTV